VHRDVQPDVILVDANGKAVLADLSWSAAKESDGGVSTDVYSLGITLYALLTGIEPFGAANPDEMMAQQVEEGAPSPNLMVLQAPPPVIRALRKMVHYDPMRRYASMAEVAEGLDQVAK
jgi:serine/threonine-protein kinase